MSDADDRDAQAAEYVLGTLDAGERASVALRLPGDADLARRVAAWEARLAPLLDAVSEIPPPPAVYASIAFRLFGEAATAAVATDGTALLLRQRLRRWQAATAGFALLAASLLTVVAVREASPLQAPRRFTAVLQREAGAPAMVVDVDLGARRLTVLPFAAAPTGRCFELWIIDPALGAPRSLGVLPVGDASVDSLQAFDPAVITGATYAVTVEPLGGSPTGRPSTAPLLTGRLSPSST